MRAWAFPTAIIAGVLAGCGGDLGSGGTAGSSGTAGISGHAGMGGTAATGGTAGRTCEYGANHTLLRLSLSVTLPDGSVQACANLTRPDAGGLGPFSGEISGSITQVGGSTFNVDTCVAGTGCSPQVFQFAIDAPDLPLLLPQGRRVTVKWTLSSFIGWACLPAIVVTDELPSGAPAGTSPALWLAGTDAQVQPSLALPFSVAQQALSCNPNPSTTHPCGGFSPPDDYALVFTPASGEPPLSLTTGQTNTLTLTTAAGLQQLTVRNVRSYQTEYCDDYWNWGWWAMWADI